MTSINVGSTEYSIKSLRLSQKSGPSKILVWGPNSRKIGRCLE